MASRSRSPHERRLPLIKTRLLHYQKKGQVGGAEDLAALAFAISGLGFNLGFMGPEVFGFAREDMRGAASRIAKMLAGGAMNRSQKSSH